MSRAFRSAVIHAGMWIGSKAEIGGNPLGQCRIDKREIADHPLADFRNLHFR